MFEIMLGGSGSGKPVVPGGESMFIREVPASEFITGDALASAIGLYSGTSQHSDAGWLKFEDTVDGKTKYVAKRPLRHSISWDQIHATRAVFGTRTVVIKGDTYKVRLLSGTNTNPSTAVAGTYDHPGTHGCEWNRLMYHISAKPFGDSNNTLASEGITEGDWASYSEADLLTHSSGGNGSRSWCQETGTTGTRRIERGYSGVSAVSYAQVSAAYSPYGWRPVLELVE